MIHVGSIAVAFYLSYQQGIEARCRTTACMYHRARFLVSPSGSTPSSQSGSGEWYLVDTPLYRSTQFRPGIRVVGKRCSDLLENFCANRRDLDSPFSWRKLKNSWIVDKGIHTGIGNRATHIGLTEVDRRLRKFPYRRRLGNNSGAFFDVHSRNVLVTLSPPNVEFDRVCTAANSWPPRGPAFPSRSLIWSVKSPKYLGRFPL